jgi:crotonobetaine/carnitine-CoA ligase
MNIPQFLEQSYSRNSEKTYLFFQDQEISYKNFYQNVHRAANWFLKLGIKKGDRVCIYLPNCPEFLYIWLGLSHMGGISVPINVNYKEKEASYILKHSGCIAVVGNADTLKVVKNVRTYLADLKYTISAGERGIGPNTIEFASFINEKSELRVPYTLSEDEISSIMYTSGTTGPPKGVMVTHRAYVYGGRGYTYWADISDKDRLFTCLPLYHANAQYYSTMGSLAAGASLILVDRFSASRFWEQIRRYGATIFNFIGAMLVILMKQSEGSQDRQHQVRLAYGTPALDQELQDYIENRFGITVLAGYALTECIFGTIQPFNGIRKHNSIGIPRYHPGFKNMIRIVNEQGEELQPGEVGEIIIKNPTVTPGYFQDPEESKKVIRNGWLHTGDNAYRDKDGYFYFVDRKKDVIRRRGENMSSLEIEKVLNANPKILESAVIGVPSEFFDEEIKAYIIPKPGETIEPIEIFEWCEQRLAHFKVPRFLELRESVPKTPTHRIEKYKLRREKVNLTEGCIDRVKLDLSHLKTRSKK